VVRERANAGKYRRPGFWKRLRQGNLSDSQLGYLLLAPALLTLLLVMLYPVATVLWQSLHGEHLLRPWLGSPFVGLEHFQGMFWGQDMVWDTQHLRVARGLGLASVVLVAAAAWRGRVGRRAAIGWGLLAVLAFGRVKYLPL
jgi:multiple sugar transport system permease protein